MRSIRPEKLIQSVRMDFSKPEFWKGGFKVIQNMLDELKDLV